MAPCDAPDHSALNASFCHSAALPRRSGCSDQRSPILDETDEVWPLTTLPKMVTAVGADHELTIAFDDAMAGVSLGILCLLQR